MTTLPPWERPEVLEALGNLSKAAHQSRQPAGLLNRTASMDRRELAELVLAAVSLIDPQVPYRLSQTFRAEMPLCSKSLHRMTPDNTAWHKNGEGNAVRQRCKQCIRDKASAYQQYLRQAKAQRAARLSQMAS